ncbi:MAG: nucleotide sugar dehydrogenase [Acidobacteriota bacterium]|nr:nucleotide sugar dehydrogenase [Acidobacteriota bacterium]
MAKEKLTELIETNRAHVGVIGLGYVGLPLAVEFAHHGFTATGFEVDESKAARINSGESYIGDVPSAAVRELVDAKRLAATTDFDRLAVCDAIIICVPTPLRKTKEPDISYILAAAGEIQKRLRSGQLVILESTTYPGTTDEVLLPILEETGLKLDEDFLLAFSPERVDPGNPQFHTHNIPKVVGGCTPDSTEVAAMLYGRIVKEVHAVSAARVAEAAKLLENTFRAVNIGMANEMARLCYALNIDTWEVIRAAATKPFGFMAFYPGPGIGGHCVVGDETVVVEEDGARRLIKLENLFQEQSNKKRVRKFNVGRQTEVIYQPDLKALSLDTETQTPTWQPVDYLFRREYEGALVTFATSDNRHLTVTDRHPLLVCVGDQVVEKFAKDLQPGDRLPVHYLPPPVAGGAVAEVDSPIIDMLAMLPPDKLTGVGVRIIDGAWRQFAQTLRCQPGVTHDHLRLNRLPASVYLELERSGLLSLPHEKLELLTGKGPSQTSFPAVVRLTSDLARLVGYYLAEGCSSDERGLRRVRFTFNAAEHEYIADVRRLLKDGLGLGTSLHFSKIDRAAHIRVGSRLFGELLEILRCGHASHNMRVPDVLFNASVGHRIELLKGLFRGDGDVYLAPGRSSYVKDGRAFTHSNVSVEVGYFSSSAELFQQTLYLLQSLGFLPTIKKSKPHLAMKGREQVSRLQNWFLGVKAEKIDNYLRDSKRAAHGRTFKFTGDLVTVPVKSVETKTGRAAVYSLEVGKTHTFATSYGIYVHNCIPLDPHYLSWKARQHGFDSRFISLAEEVNSRMPEHVVQLISDGLNDERKALRGARVLLLGVAYKKDINDVRESPALSIIDRLRAKGAEVRYHDPFVAEIDFHDAHTQSNDATPLQSVALTDDELSESDCVVIVTDHSDIDYRRVTDLAPVVVDTRNALSGDVRRASHARVIRL